MEPLEPGGGLTGNLTLPQVRAVERLALHAWPALEVEEVEGWLLRHAAGVTRRANSVWPNKGRMAAVLPEHLSTVEEFYHVRGLPARFQICPSMRPVDLDQTLATRGYRAVTRTAVQTATVAEVQRRLAHTSRFPVRLDDAPTATWWACYAVADDVRPQAVAARHAICSQIQAAAAYACAQEERMTIAVGSAVVEDGWIGLFNIATLPTHRRMGAAHAVLAKLMAWGAAQGATQAYLQVMENNAPALALYARLGFTTGYCYHYREETRT